MRSLVAALAALALSCAHGRGGGGGDSELLAFSQVPPDLVTSVTAEVKRQEKNVSVDDVTPLWESLFVVPAPPRFRTFKEAPPPGWPKELEPNWAEALAVCQQRLGETPDLLSRAVTLCNAQLSDVLWNQYLAYRNARGSLAVSFKALKTGEVGVEVVRIVAGAAASCTRVESAPADAATAKVFGFVHTCFGEKPASARLTATKMPTRASAGPPVPETPPPERNPRLETKLSMGQMPPLDLGPGCELRPGSLLIDNFLAPTFSRLLEQRWTQAQAGASNSVECALTGDFERRAGAGGLPLNINTYALDCAGRIAKISVVTEDELWPEHATRKLLVELSQQFCPH